MKWAVSEDEAFSMLDFRRRSIRLFGGLMDERVRGIEAQTQASEQETGAYQILAGDTLDGSLR